MNDQIFSSWRDELLAEKVGSLIVSPTERRAPGKALSLVLARGCARLYKSRCFSPRTSVAGR